MDNIVILIDIRHGLYIMVRLCHKGGHCRNRLLGRPDCFQVLHYHLVICINHDLQFRHFANKVGNLERPFLKEFFPRWVGSCGCPVLRCDQSILPDDIDLFSLEHIN